MRRVVLPVTAAAVAALLLSGCSTGTDSASAPPGSPAPSTAPVSAAPTPTAASTPSAAGQVIEVRYTAGRITGVDQRVSVPLGKQVVLRVVSDVTEEIHVHGYDVYVELQPGDLAETTFTADKPGTWEVELHEAGRPLFQLQVA